MIYTSMTIKAMKLAYKAHEGQVDRSGVPYIFHPIHLAEQMETEDEICTALLHDVAEDSDCTIEDLKKEGFRYNSKKRWWEFEVDENDISEKYYEFMNKYPDVNFIKK